MEIFSSKSEMLKYGKTLGKYNMESVLLNGKTVCLCGTNLAYENALSEIAENALSSALSIFSKNTENDIDSVSELKDFIFRLLAKNYDIETVEAYNEY